ncbi:MAG TPA: polyribonucleotide nucleotidyltransferase [Candidatus Babeliales bacterium]|jgi:polyribonucleotide nucleotidyltransferase|nr:polyribonucleotide nucleotidyltransferase [Candidatus Babeliales bacterium]
MTKKFRLNEFDYEVEIGKVAKQADGAVWFTKGGNVIMVAATSAPSSDFPGFLPLSIDYREQFSAAGKIPGGYYKREGKLSDHEVLTGRLIDRALRPIFPQHFFDQVQIVATVYSVDKQYAPNVMALTASSIALCISPIPFLEPVGAVEISLIDGSWVINPLYEDSKRSEARLVVAGTYEGICMVEGHSNELPESEFLNALFKAHEAIRSIVLWQKEIQKEFGVVKADIKDPYRIDEWLERANTYLTEEHITNIYIDKKAERNAYLQTLRDGFSEHYKAELEALNVPDKVVEYIFDEALNPRITNRIFEIKKRVDNRSFEQVRSITIDIGLLPFAHGSALFTRGETQALVSITLGSGQDEQRIESIMETEEKHCSFMLHYNFPPFSVGEVRPLRSPGRREVGHGYLAGASFKYELPVKEDFPYTIRIISDILESNGSSSMATVCASTMGLMQAGVPIRHMVAGIAMGLLKSDAYGFAILSDINGFEDAFGLMDFKVIGTVNGISAIQMDIKYRGGLSREILYKALEQARLGRLHILDVMSKVMNKPNPTLSNLVPKVVKFMINTDKIGAIIGSGGKTIREIIEKTGTEIDIEPNGLVRIFANPEAKLDLAIRWVKTLAGQIEVGSVYEGIVRRIVDFGIFVELVPGLDGLVHISNIPREMQKTFSQYYKPNDIVRVKVIDYDESTSRISLRIEQDAKPSNK